MYAMFSQLLVLSIFLMNIVNGYVVDGHYEGTQHAEFLKKYEHSTSRGATKRTYSSYDIKTEIDQTYYGPWEQGVIGVYGAPTEVEDTVTGRFFDANDPAQVQAAFKEYMTKTNTYRHIGDKAVEVKKREGDEKKEDGGCADGDPDLAFACAMVEWLCNNVAYQMGQEWTTANC
eukprot:409456_1